MRFLLPKFLGNGKKQTVSAVAKAIRHRLRLQLFPSLTAKEAKQKPPEGCSIPAVRLNVRAELSVRTVFGFQFLPRHAIGCDDDEANQRHQKPDRHAPVVRRPAHNKRQIATPPMDMTMKDAAFF